MDRQKVSFNPGDPEVACRETSTKLQVACSGHHGDTKVGLGRKKAKVSKCSFVQVGL